MPYQPSSPILFVTICSFNKAAGGEPTYDAPQSILAADFPEDLRQKLLQVRQRIWRIVKKTDEIDWGGVTLPELEFNTGLMEGADFGGKAAAAYFPALRRYDGRFYQTLGVEGKQKLYRSPHHLLILSGLYGLVRPFESIQLYSCPLKAPIAQEWRKTDILTSVLSAYARQHHIMRVFDLSAVAAYRDLIDWDAFGRFSGAQVLHAFDTMGMGDNALVPFGRLMKDTLLEAPEAALLGIEPAKRYGTTVKFLSLAETPPGLPNELRALHRAEQEAPLLKAYSTIHLDEVLQGGNPLSEQESPRAEDWLFTMSSDFRKGVENKDRKMQGRILKGILAICREPTVEIIDTQEPLTGILSGKWCRHIGNYRLIYLPDPTKQTLHLLDFGPRGDIYNR